MVPESRSGSGVMAASRFGAASSTGMWAELA